MQITTNDKLKTVLAKGVAYESLPWSAFSESSWHMDETYVKVNGRWVYLYRAVDQRGDTIDFYLSSRSNTKAAYCFLGKILNNVKQ